MGQRYGVRPSRFIEGLGEFQSITLDIAAAQEGARVEAEEIRKAKNRGR